MISATSLLWLALALAGYYLVLRTNPVRGSLRDGLRAMRRYPSLWIALGLCGFAYAAFQLATRAYLHRVMPEDQRPVFTWLRDGTGPGAWWQSSWIEARSATHDAVLPALDGVAGIFNNLVSTFPLAALAAVLLLVNWNGHQAVLARALRKRFGRWGIAVHLAILLCALAALLKPFVYFGPRYVEAELWFQWAPVLVWVAFLFEYLFGVFVQVLLILVAYCWVRGLIFTQQHLMDFAIRRSSFVLRWAAVVMILSSIFIDLPLVLKNFMPAESWFAPAEPETVDRRLMLARVVINTVLLLFATMQVTLVFHSESLARAFRDHFRFLGRNAWSLIWFVILAGIHFYLLHAADRVLRHGLGEGTAPWIGWSLLFPWLEGLMGAWLLASWVILFRRCESGRASEDWIPF